MNDHSERKGVAVSRTKRPTIRDVAAAAAVSHQTVSRFLRNAGGLRPETSAAIEKAIAELDYRPDLKARSMRTRRTETLAVVISGTPRGDLYLRELAAACGVAHEAGYRSEVVIIVGDSQARASRIADLLSDGQVDGVLSLAPVGSAQVRADPRVVVTEDLDDGGRNIGVFADGATLGEVVRYLADLGHQHFLHVAGDPGFASARNRIVAYEDAIQRLGLTSHGVVGHSWSAEAGHDAVADLPFDSAVTAVITANDTAAFGAIRAAVDRGWSVPGRLSVFGWDDQAAGRFAIPALSTVAVDREARGRHVMELLIASIESRPAPPTPTADVYRLVPRESTARPS